MRLGLIGLGKMGANLALNLKKHGHDVVAYDLSLDRLKEAKDSGVTTADSMEELINSLGEEKIVWLMIPAGKPVDETIERIKTHLNKGDIIIDGGNSFYKDSIRRYNQLKEIGIEFLDAGTSGGREGALNGVCAMVGGDKETFNRVEALFKDISVDKGYLHVGKAGSGHFTKMVHNGIEYGMLQAIGEGFEILENSGFQMDYEKIADLWNHGSVIRGWLMELSKNAFSKDPHLDEIKGAVGSNGEGLWTAQTALEMQIPAPVITTSVIMRYRSQQEDTFTGKVVAALRNEFGGHEVKKK
ncbi:6-phosphogluconate dehydrogenase [Clostridium tetanomorphum]|uniref:Decarboxylating 6-phosphogluconate dehydrogenase n=2 Tax=Clostridium tetanomorphum TaxID=1553 RepID=A0A923EA10_CLOTT|nr:6-phosphogluconate dehydrogenase-like protein [Clostridium tetanomorphum DSM 665]MBC2397987.1 decarboxylating 6-phosphogluconate dehydrogenase [Clostridium tetanomorphum]KAJ51617.1 6-phosphogluconate dehydrogenase-like protein [Clostridium tetanomorphum DSM 665]MBP1864507.1 6-phosphogluconate dehydrogenase [Clostridium tetanomorphum]NRS82962.1 6-phosphogluconate dehydrogenase [Clostridium tetanomorphum]